MKTKKPTSLNKKSAGNRSSKILLSKVLLPKAQQTCRLWQAQSLELSKLWRLKKSFNCKLHHKRKKQGRKDNSLIKNNVINNNLLEVKIGQVKVEVQVNLLQFNRPLMVNKKRSPLQRSKGRSP